MTGRTAGRRGDGGTTLVELTIALAIFGLIITVIAALWMKAQAAYFVGAELAEVQQNLRTAADLIVSELRAAGRDGSGCAFDYGTVGDCSGGPHGKVAICQARLGGNYDTANGQGGVGCQQVFVLPAADLAATAIRFRSDRNANGRLAGSGNSDGTDAAAEDVTYRLRTGSPPCPAGVAACITRSEQGGGAVALVAVDITGFQLGYFPRPGFAPCDGAPPPTPCPGFTLPLTQLQADNVGRIRLTMTAQQSAPGGPVSRTVTTDVVLANRR